MFGNGKHPQLRPTKWLAVGVACVTVAVSIALTWRVFGADSNINKTLPSAPKATKFQFARMRYPGGIPDYVKNWYTDYPNMDRNLTSLMQRLTGVDVGPPI